jgi:hypothetical protein
VSVPSKSEAVFESPDSGDATSHSQLKLFGKARTLGRHLPTDKDFEDEELSNALHNRSCSNDNPQVQTCGRSAPVTAGGSPIFPSRRMHAIESTVWALPSCAVPIAGTSWTATGTRS